MPDLIVDRIYKEMRERRLGGGGGLVVLDAGAPMTMMDDGGEGSIDLVALIEIGKFVVGLFQEDDGSDVQRELQNIGGWIERVSGQLAQIATALDAIRDAIRRLELKIDEAFRADAERGLRAAIQQYTTNLAALKANPGADPLTFGMGTFYQEVQRESLLLMQYGYEHVLTIGFALRAEIDLARIIKVGPAVTKQIGSNYKAYFAQALDGNYPGTVTRKLQECRERVRTLEASYTAGDKGSMGRQWFYREWHGGQAITYFYRIDGSLEQGFTAGKVTVDEVHGDNDREPSWYLPNGAAAAAHALRVVIAEKLPPYNEASARYRVLKSNEKRLEALKKAVEGLLALATKIST